MARKRPWANGAPGRRHRGATGVLTCAPCGRREAARALALGLEAIPSDGAVGMARRAHAKYDSLHRQVAARAAVAIAELLAPSLAHAEVVADAAAHVIVQLGVARVVLAVVRRPASRRLTLLVGGHAWCTAHARAPAAGAHSAVSNDTAQNKYSAASDAVRVGKGKHTLRVPQKKKKAAGAEPRWWIGAGQQRWEIMAFPHAWATVGPPGRQQCTRAFPGALLWGTRARAEGLRSGW